MSKTSKTRVLFNDSENSLPLSKGVVEGGTFRFSQIFINFFKKSKEVELISLFFSKNNKDDRIFSKKIELDRAYYGITFPSRKFSIITKKGLSKKDYIKHQERILTEVGNVLEESKPDLIFLNGFYLSTWYILEGAYRKNIPICIQHAGIWKKEIISVKKSLPTSIRRIFASLEKDCINKATYQIFLNEFSRNTFFKIHNIKQDKQNLKKTTIIPLPINSSKTKKMHLDNKNVLNIGVIARWDRIKNHAAVQRFSSYCQKSSLPIKINVVTKWREGIKSDFKDLYIKTVNIVPPMSSDKLKNFYQNQDIILIPSRYDVSPNVLMEAMAAGKPVIISNQVGWVSDYNKFKLQDLVLSPADSGEKIYKVIENLLNEKNKYLPRFEKLQNKIIKSHNTESVFDQYYNLFKKIYDSSK